MNQVTLGSEAIPDLRYRVAMLHLLVCVATLIRDFYDEFRHFPVFLAPGSRTALSAQSNIPAYDPERR